jgi:hypothetical protein
MSPAYLRRAHTLACISPYLVASQLGRWPENP